MTKKFKIGDIVYIVGYNKDNEVSAVECVVTDYLIFKKYISYTVMLTERSVESGNKLSIIYPNRIRRAHFENKIFSNANACLNSYGQF